MARRPSGKLSFESLNSDIRSYLSGMVDDQDVTRAIRELQAAQAKVRKITKSITKASLGRAARAGFEIKDGTVREPQPTPAGRQAMTGQPLLSATDAELEQARDVQRKLLPAKVPDLPGLDIATYSRFCRDVGGDYFDFIPLPRGRHGLIVADVSGKGIPAAMVMIMFRSIFRMVAANDHTPVEVLVHTNRLVKSDLLRGMFISAIYAVTDPEKKRMILVNAGHNPPLIWRPRLTGTRAINIKGPAIGLLPPDRFEPAIRQKSLALESGDCLCFYTDGVTEAKNLLGDDFGPRALARAFRDSPRASAQSSVDAIVAAVDDHQAEAPQHDDITLVVLRIL